MLLIAFSFSAKASKNSLPYDSQWIEAESLTEKGQGRFEVALPYSTFSYTPSASNAEKAQKARDILTKNKCILKVMQKNVLGGHIVVLTPDMVGEDGVVAIRHNLEKSNTARKDTLIKVMLFSSPANTNYHNYIVQSFKSDCGYFTCDKESLSKSQGRWYNSATNPLTMFFDTLNGSTSFHCDPH